MQAISFENVSFSYNDEKPILDGASFEIAESEFVALVGENGSGKSTIAKMADSFLLPNSGNVIALGKDIAEVAKSGNDALLKLRCNIGYVQQNPDNQFVATRVIDEVAFGPSGLGLSKEEVLDRVKFALAQVGAEDLAYRDVNTLSGGQKQRISIADALAMRPDLMIFDEPTSMLDEDGKADIAEIILGLHRQGTAILLITHSVYEAELAERVLKIEDGKVAPCNDIGLEQEEAFSLVNEYASNQIRDTETFSNQNPLIRFEKVSFEYNEKDSLVDGLMGVPSQPHIVFENFDMDLHENEFLCVAGPNGSGKSTLASLANGLLKPTSGQVVVCGKSTADKRGSNAARRHVGVCFQYPERSLFCQTVLDEAAFGPKNMGFSKQEAEDRAREALESVGIIEEDVFSSSPFDLSGGMQRKVAFASVLSMKPDVLVMDEPCAGLDIKAHAEFVMLLLKLKAIGQSIIMVTHDKRDIDILADRVIFLS